MAEFVAVVDEHDVVVGVEALDKVHERGILHREAYVYLINSRREVLLQRRADNGLWDHSAAGHFSKDETYVQGALREFEEELGVKIDVEDLHEIASERLETAKPNKKNVRFVKVFLVRKDIPLERFKIDRGEVAAVKFFTEEGVQDLLRQPDLLTGSAKFLIEKYVLNLLTGFQAQPL
jgi:isopentenyldiphosphate isomerase